MAESDSSSYSMGNSSGACGAVIDKKPKARLIATRSIPFEYRSSSKVASPRCSKFGTVAVTPVTSFLLKVAALELVRRFSKSRCPLMWSALQAMQVVCYPPLKFIQRWNPFATLVKGMQMLSQPLLVLSVATAFSDHSGSKDSHINGIQEPHANNRTQSPTPTISPCDEGSCSPSKSWLLKLQKELHKQGILLPDRIDEQELQRFYDTALGDFPSFLSLVKKTISWRENYRILSVQELERWRSLLFWHGFEINQQPCLIVRLGLACMSLPFHERPQFAQAIVSQVEYGVLHLLDDEYPRITVLVDCEGLSPIRVPMQMMRSCSSILQEHFPKRLGYIFVIRLPPVAQVIAQAFIQFLKPGTKRKLKIMGKMYQKDVIKYVQTLPSYLGGNCMCMKCRKYPVIQKSCVGETSSDETLADYVTSQFPESLGPTYQDDHNSDDFTTYFDPSHGNVIMPTDCNQSLRTAVVGLLIVWVMIALIAVLSDPESRPSLSMLGK